MCSAILVAVLEHEVFLLGLGKQTTETVGFDHLRLFAGGVTFSGDSLLEFAGLHGEVVVQLAELLGESVGAVSNSGLGLAAAISDLRLKVTLSELGLIPQSSDVVVDVSELIAEDIFDITDRVADAVDGLRGVICTGFEFSDVGRIGNSKVSQSSSTETATAAEAAKAATETAAETAEATEATPAAKAEKQEKQRPQGIHSIIHSVAAVHSCKHFPTAAVAVATIDFHYRDGVRHFPFSFLCWLSFAIFPAMGHNVTASGKFER